METQSRSREASAQADGVGRPLPPYPLTLGNVGLWLRRGERLGRAACWIAATVAAGHKHVATWRRQVASKGPIDTPPQPG